MMDYDSMQKAGSRLGTGTMIILDDKTCPVGMVPNLERFFARESCGWCTPCREGLPWVADILTAIENGSGPRGRSADTRGADEAPRPRSHLLRPRARGHGTASKRPQILQGGFRDPYQGGTLSVQGSMISIYVDGAAYEVKGDQSLLRACLSLGIDVPYFCWHPGPRIGRRLPPVRRKTLSGTKRTTAEGSSCPA